jgi:hypothetical protein
MKQTAVELLKQRLIKDQQVFPIYTEYINGILYDIDNELLEMEKQQIQDAYRISPNNEIWSNSGIDYYNETFKSQIYVDATPNDIDRGPR